MIWTKEQAEENHFHSWELAYWLFHNLNAESGVLDIGCGNGQYVEWLIERGFRAMGVEGTTFEDKPYIMQFDLSKKTDLPKIIKSKLKKSDYVDFDYNQVISIEVGEHIDKEFENNFFDNLTTDNVEKIVLSWAVPYQGGLGHVNERPNTYVMSQMKKRGFANKVHETLSVRKAVRKCKVCPWLKNTIIVYERIK